MMSKFFHGWGILLFVLGCQPKQQQLEIDTVAIDLDQAKTISVWDLCSEIELLPLETSDSCFMTIVYPTVYKNQYFMRQNNPNLVNCFDSAGHFLYGIHNQGRGGDEYNYINDIIGDPAALQLYLPEVLDCVNLYDLETHLLKKIHLDSVRGVIQEVIPLNRDTLLIASGRYNLTLTFFSQRENRVIAQKKDYLPAVISRPFFRVGSQVFYNAALDNIIYEVRDTAFVPVWGIDLGKYKNDPVNYEQTARLITNDGLLETFMDRFHTVLTRVEGNTNYFYLTYLLQKEGKWQKIFVWLDRHSGEYFVFDEFEEQVNWDSFGSLEEKEFISVLYVAEKEENLDCNLLNEKNRTIYQNIKFDDNPVIVKYKLK